MFSENECEKEEGDQQITCKGSFSNKLREYNTVSCICYT